MIDQLVLRVSLIKDDYCNGCPCLSDTGFCRGLQRWVRFFDDQLNHQDQRPDDCPLEYVESLYMG